LHRTGGVIAVIAVPISITPSPGSRRHDNKRFEPAVVSALADWRNIPVYDGPPLSLDGGLEGDAMTLFEIPEGLTTDLHKALTTLHRCCEMVHGWGTWHDVPFDAANFTTSSPPGTWTVSAANVKTLKYQVVHHTMTVAFEVIQASVSGPIAGLLIALPLPYQCLQRPSAGTLGLIDNGILFTNTCMIRQDLGLHRPGTVALVNEAAGSLVLLIQLPNGENINAVGEAGALGQITFEVRPA
jgi:hypothetical protein